MTAKEVRGLAKAVWDGANYGTPEEGMAFVSAKIASAICTAVEAEREACAKIAEEMRGQPDTEGSCSATIAAAIRARA